jgi:hypothetical protein
MTRQHKKPFPWFIWHRRFGLVALLLLIILAITGIALNHTEELKLNHKIIANDWILDWYGLNPEGEAISFVINNDARITQWGEKVFFNDNLLTDTQDRLIGATASGKYILVIALSNSLLLLDANGELIEQISPGFVPIKHLGRLGASILVETHNGKRYQADKNIVSWQEIETKDAQWSTAVDLPTAWQQRIKRNWRGNGLTAERVILDLHSGRFFNASWGVYIMDASAIIMLLLGLSGSWIWWSRRHKISTKKHFQKHHR